MVITILAIFVGLMGLSLIGAGMMYLHHLLKIEEQQAMTNNIKTVVIPEIMQESTKMLNDSIDQIMEKSIEMTKKMMKAQYDYDD